MTSQYRNYNRKRKNRLYYFHLDKDYYTMIVNLFDKNFEQSVCSTAWATPQNIEYVRGKMEFDGVTIFTDTFINNPIVDSVKSKFKLGWLREPKCLHEPEYQYSTNWNKMNLILTYHKGLIEDYGAVFSIYGGVWVPRAEWGLHPKTKLVSMLYGDKRTTYGHQLRHLIGEMFPRGIDYFGFKGEKVNYSPETKVKVHKDYMFSICIETCKENYLFTEILLDAFMCGTVPIFWGCPEIGTFFDERGILSFDSIPELRSVLSQVSPSLYKSMLPYAQENLERAKEYSITEDWMFKNILHQFES